jgi:asparagine synthetase B (glutamine-hydrolysing)
MISFQLYRRFVRQLRLLKVPPRNSDAVAVALSGGPDSTALAAMTARWHKDTQNSKVGEPWFSGSGATTYLCLLLDIKP